MSTEGIKLHTLKNIARPFKKRKDLGRGPGSGKGKTCGRGQKGMGARSGYKIRQGTEGGGVPLHRRVPTRGFSNARFAKKMDTINLGQIDAMYQEGEVVSVDTLKKKGFLQQSLHGIKVLGKGELTKKVKFQVKASSQSVKDKLKKLQIEI